MTGATKIVVSNIIKQFESTMKRLIEYTRHLPECGKVIDARFDECTCGLDVLLKEVGGE